MNEKTILSQLAKLVNVKEGKIKREMTIKKDLKVDSLKYIVLITKIEEIFNVDIPDSEWFEVSTVGDITDLIIEYSE